MGNISRSIRRIPNPELVLLFPLGVLTLPEVGSQIISYCTTGINDTSFHFVRSQKYMDWNFSLNGYLSNYKEPT